MKYFMAKLEEIYKIWKTDPNQGLTEEVILELQQKNGLNKFDEEKRETLFEKIFHHLKDFTSLILLFAAGVAFFMAFQPDSEKGFTDAIVIFSIVVINVSLAIWQERGAEMALESLKRMTAQMTTVIRGGVRQVINAEQLVPGDIITFESGDMIPADARIIESINLRVDESILTGESVPVEKDSLAEIEENAPLGDQFNMMFSGCLITGGKGKAVVVETGMSTEMGKIAGLLNNTKKEKTPLQKKMDKLVKVICGLAITSGVILFGIQTLYHHLGRAVIPVSERVLDMVSLAVAAIPEGLPIVITITLAYSVLNMSQKNAIIRKIPAVETLGSASIICSDKTGTLTMNRMSIQRVWAVSHEPLNAKDEFTKDEIRLLELMGLSSNATIEIIDGKEKTIGDPTETAIIRLLKDKDITKESVELRFPRIHEIPFDSDRKLMTTVHETDGVGLPKYISITKGAFDRIPIDAISICADTAKRIHNEFANDALRVLAVAYKYYDQLPENLDSQELEHGLTFGGFVGIIDPPRPESKQAVQIAKDAGIKTIMITGDHALTATAIAKDIGILSDGEKAMTGVELAKISDEELANNVKNYSVYARVTPEDKIRIVKAWQSHGEVVAMTGDGVNDAPALKAADIGVAMGSGTDVSKSASDVILTDDNFSSIVAAVSEGRRVYDNVRKVLISLIPSNIAEVVVMILGFVIWGRTPLYALQLLFINVVADGIPDLCMCREELEDDAMLRKPIPKHMSVFAYGLLGRTILAAIVFTVVTMIGYYVGITFSLGGIEPSHEIGRTMAYVTLAWASVVNILNVRSFNKSLFTIGFMSNRLLFGGICLSLSLVTATALLPGVREIFRCVPLSSYHWFVMISLASSPFFIVELRKLYMRKKGRSIGGAI